MIGQPFNPAQCVFLLSQAFNANQFDPNVPDAANIVPHNLLWNFIENKLQWVNSLTNIIVRELSNGAGIQNELFTILSAGPFDLNTNQTVQGGNFLLLNPGTYAIEAEYTYQADQAGAETAVLQIRTNTNQSLTGVDASDAIVAERDTHPGGTQPGNGNAVLTQTAKCETLTFAVPVIVKTSLATLANAAFAQNILLRAILVK